MKGSKRKKSIRNLRKSPGPTKLGKLPGGGASARSKPGKPTKLGKLPKGGKLKRLENGGKLEGLLEGPSHEEGGIPIEVEGGEYIIKKDSVNPETEPILEFVNENGKLPKGNDYDFPTIDARKRKGGK